MLHGVIFEFFYKKSSATLNSIRNLELHNMWWAGYCKPVLRGEEVPDNFLEACDIVFSHFKNLDRLVLIGEEEGKYLDETEQAQDIEDCTSEIQLYYKALREKDHSVKVPEVIVNFTDASLERRMRKPKQERERKLRFQLRLERKISRFERDYARIKKGASPPEREDPSTGTASDSDGILNSSSDTDSDSDNDSEEDSEEEPDAQL